MKLTDQQAAGGLYSIFAIFCGAVVWILLFAASPISLESAFAQDSPARTLIISIIGLAVLSFWLAVTLFVKWSHERRLLRLVLVLGLCATAVAFITWHWLIALLYLLPLLFVVQAYKKMDA